MSMHEPTGVDLIAAERLRQIEVERFSAEHDDRHDEHELAWAAACYAAPGRIYSLAESFGNENILFLDPWPVEWDEDGDKRPRDLQDRLLAAQDIEPAERIRCLVKAGALIAAEIDRLQRRMQQRLDDGADDGASTRHYPSPENRAED